MLLHLDPTSDLPLYRQIAIAVRRAVRAGEIGPGDRLPAARDLATALGVNMHTVLRSYADLRDEGLVELRRGRGAVVLERSNDGLRHLTKELAATARHEGVELDELITMLKEEYR